MADWVVWLVLAGGLLLVELLSLTVVVGLVSAAAAVTALAAVLDVPVAGQVGVFAGVNAVLFLLVRPFERLHHRKPGPTTGTAALIGKTAIVVEPVTGDGGRVKVGGETWSARLLKPRGVLDAGSHAIVGAVDGVTLVVVPEEI